MTCAVTCDFSGSPTDASTEPDTDATEPSEPTTSASFKPELNYSDVTMSLHNETLRVKVTNLPAGKAVKWSSKDEKVAIVDEDGLVTAKGPGVTTITADVGGKTAELIVRCSFEDTAEGGYHLSLTDVTLSVGESFNLRLLDENDERVEGASYSVKDTTVCTADGSKITGKASGRHARDRHLLRRELRVHHPCKVNLTKNLRRRAGTVRRRMLFYGWKCGAHDAAFRRAAALCGA